MSACGTGRGQRRGPGCQAGRRCGASQPGRDLAQEEVRRAVVLVQADEVVDGAAVDVGQAVVVHAAGRGAGREGGGEVVREARPRVRHAQGRRGGA